MAVTWHCDICGKPTYVNPPVEQVTEIRDMTYEVPEVDPETGEVQVDAQGLPKKKPVTIKQQVPKMTKIKRQHPFTGDVEDIEVPEMKDLAERAYIVQLTVGPEQVQKDFCKECMTKHVLPEAKALWDKLAAIRSNE